MRTAPAPFGCVLAIGTLIAIVLLSVGVSQTKGQSVGEQEVKLPKLFDFANFKRLFNKRYNSFVEELSRKRLFMSRALRAFVSGVSFKYRRLNHFNALNELSDRSRQELDQMRNKLMEREDQLQLRPKVEAEAELEAESLPELLPSEDEDVELELLELLKDHGNDLPVLGELRRQFKLKSSRRKRHVEAPKEREFQLDWLINDGSLEKELNQAAEHSRPVLRNPRSNNPNYAPFDLASFGLTDQQESIKWWSVGRKANPKMIREQLLESLGSSGAGASEIGSESNGGETTDGPDELFVDHRNAGCLLEPRQQGQCGACYAFAVTTLMEWLLCQKSGKLVALSEQYMIDCGKGRFKNTLAGCEGGSVQGGAMFVHNFGLELQKNYPYAQHELQCPYEEDFDLKRTGFIRMELGDAVEVQRAFWPRILKVSPIYIKAKTGDDFVEYGGGVYSSAASCSESTNHAMVLVGHGRQDGQEFWLLRNSFGPKWGERGYWKLAKSASERCLGDSGFAFGTKTGLKYEVKPRNSKPKSKQN